MIHYLATPYTHRNQAVVQARVDETMRYAYALLKAGYTVFSPILHCHELAKRHAMPSDAQYWRDYNFAHLRMMRRVIACQIDGWRDSVGMKMEIDWARSNQAELKYCWLDNDGKLHMEEKSW